MLLPVTSPREAQTMAETYLAPIEDLATLMGKQVSDPRLLLALKRASNRFAGAVGFPVHQVKDEEIRLNGTGNPLLLLPTRNIGDISIAVDGDVLTSTGDFEVDAAAGMVKRRGAIWPTGLGNIHVTYTHGWDEVPGDIQDAVLEQASIQAYTLIHVTQESANNVSVSYGAQATVGVTTKWSECVAKYRVGHGDRS